MFLPSIHCCLNPANLFALYPSLFPPPLLLPFILPPPIFSSADRQVSALPWGNPLIPLIVAVQIDKFLHCHKISVNLAVQIDKFLHWQTGCQCRNLSICPANGRTDSFTLNIIPPSSPSLLSRPTPEKSNPPRQVETNVKKHCENLWTRCKNSYVIPVNVSGQTKIEKKERIKSAGLSPSASFHFDEDDKENVSKYATFLDAYI